MCYDVTDLDTGPDGLATLLLGHGYGIVPYGELVFLNVRVTCYASACLFLLAHPSVQVNVWNRAM